MLLCLLVLFFLGFPLPTPCLSLSLYGFVSRSSNRPAEHDDGEEGEVRVRTRGQEKHIHAEMPKQKTVRFLPPVRLRLRPRPRPPPRCRHLWCFSTPVSSPLACAES